MSRIVDSGLGAFRSTFPGQVIVATDSDYDAARSVWNGDVDRHPDVIARCRTSGDVAAAISFARKHGLEISVRGGGHSFWGAAVPEGGLMIDLSQMRNVIVDAGSHRASCGGGATGADVDAATQEYGLAVTLGTVSHTGIGGLTLGGGLGWLTNKLGLSIDNLISAEVVLADGRCVRAAADEHPDLFWALKGGGGNFGVVTNFDYQLHSVGPEVHVGLFFWELDRRAEALRLARDTVVGLPKDAGGLIGAGLSAPPAPFVPEQHHFRSGCALIVAGFSSAEEHAGLVAPIRQALPPLFEFVSPMPYTALQKMLDGAVPWGIFAYEKALRLEHLTDDAIEVIADHLPAKSSSLSFMPIFPLGGAYLDVGEDETAFGGSRTSRFELSITAMAPDADSLSADRGWVRSLWDALRPYASGSASYVNFMVEYEEDRVRAAYGVNKYERLARIKADYDPENVFHLNANIKPALQPI